MGKPKPNALRELCQKELFQGEQRNLETLVKFNTMYRLNVQLLLLIIINRNIVKRLICSIFSTFRASSKGAVLAYFLTPKTLLSSKFIQAKT
ncbi:hypothetical protein BpHYR1_028983 [Brachionus plicatilis]|uniref:Uncharacterized protein n=1 Tax=Brachionus plicatilis TaxID=10195 RepID=A0A3M7RNK9_BRAPC|nr:hypothetical protein BpHYR1_028983 [Brachionus plicatilis]